MGETILKLNNYDYSDDFLDILKNYLQTRNLQPNLGWTDRKIAIFIDRYSTNWTVRNNKIIYTPRNLEVVYQKDISNTLLNLYEDPREGTGTAIKSFYNKVIDKYLGIKRKVVEEFLKGQTSYQLTKEPRKPINKPIISRFPNERWSADLIDMQDKEGFNARKKWILTVIDNFSKYVFAVPLVNKNAQTVLDGFQKIITDQADGTYPQVLQTDNGGEFKNEIMKAWTRQHNIHHAFSASYQPTSNALVENFNNLLRRMIREGYIRNNSLNWVNHLPDYLYNRNHSKHSTTKHKPVELWRPGKQTVTEHPTEELQDASDRIQERARRELEKNKAQDFEVGDYVRILLSAINSKVRSIIKAGKKKLLPVKYTPNIYTVAEVIKPRGRDQEFVKKRYKLNDSTGQPKLTELKRNNPNAVRKVQVFFGTDLQKVTDTKPKKLINTSDAEKLNSIPLDEIKVDEPAKPKSKPKPKAEPEEKIHQTRSKTQEPVTHSYPLRSRARKV